MSGADDRYDALLCPAPRVGALRDKYASDVCLSVAYVGRKSRTERPRKTKIGTDVAYVTRDSDTTFKVKMSKVNLQEAGHIVAASRTACLTCALETMDTAFCLPPRRL